MSAGQDPVLQASEALMQWRRDWETEESARYNMMTEERRAKEAEEKAHLLESLQTQVDKLSRELKEAREAMMAGRGFQAELQRQAEEELEREDGVLADEDDVGAVVTVVDED